MSSEKTGRALGTLNPVIYFKMEKDAGSFIGYMSGGQPPKGWIILPPCEIGAGGRTAKLLFENKYKDLGYSWGEAGTLREVDNIQGRLVDQEHAVGQYQGEQAYNSYSQKKDAVASSLRQRMASSSCTPWERDFIKLWLDMDPKKRDRYTQRFTERNSYLWAREMDEHTLITDRMATD